MITEIISIISLLAWLVGPLTRWVALRGERAEARLGGGQAGRRPGWPLLWPGIWSRRLRALPPPLVLPHTRPW